MSGGRRAAGRVPRIVPFDSRQRIAAALERCSRSERQLLALLIWQQRQNKRTIAEMQVRSTNIENYNAAIRGNTRLGTQRGFRPLVIVAKNPEFIGRH